MARNIAQLFASILLIALPILADEVKLELKNVDDGQILVFYHDRWNILTPSMIGNQGRVRSDKPIELKHLSNTKHLFSSIKLSNANIIDFRIKPEYKFDGNIYGENLVAFKLKKYKEPEKEKKKDPPQKKIAKIEKVHVNLSDIGVNVLDNQKNKQITFPFATKDIGVAIFQRGRDLWVIFDRRKDFFIPKASFINSYAQQSDPDNTIIKITMAEDLYPNISKQKNNWILSFAKEKQNPANSLKPKTISDSIVSIKGLAKAGNIVTLRDPNVGDILKILPVKSPNLGIEKEENKLDYKILESSQGIAISLVSDQVKTIYNEKNQSLDIISTYMLGQIKDTKNKKDKILEPIISFNSTELDEASYLQTKEYLQNNLLLSGSDNAKANSMIDLAKFYFNHRMYHESSGMLNQLPKFSEKLSLAKEQMLTKAVAMALSNRALEARDIFAELKQNFSFTNAISEIELWDRFNEFQLGNKPASIIGQEKELVHSYPDDIYWEFIFGELDILASKKDVKSMDNIIKAIRKSTDISVNNRIKYYKAKYFYLLKQINLAQNILEEVKQNAQNGKEYLMAELQLVKILYEQKRLDWISAVQRLNSLRFVWRGDKYEHQLLMASAMAYQQNNDVINAIRTYKYILDAFGKHSENNFFVTQQIVDLYRRIFLSNEMQELDDFSVVALFYEFKDYTPIGADGDRVVLGIARRMLNLDLLEMASSILEHQVMYRLRGTERMVTANHLALVLLMDRKPIEALKILNETDNENFGFMQHQKRTLLKAKALIDMEKYEDALSYIGDDKDPDALLLKSEILFRSARWADYIKFSEAKMKAKFKEGDVITGDDEQDALRLAMAYSMLNRISDLTYLQQNIITENKELKSVLEFLKSSNAPIDPFNLDKMIGVDTMQSFLDNYRKLLFE